MIFEQNTILVLGAGASRPYGFPLGADLKQRIIKITKDMNTTQGRQLSEAGFSHEQVAEFNTDLLRSIHPTIDAFLEDRPSRREIGAFTIAQILMPLETENNLYPHKDWYPILFSELDFRDYRHPANVTAVITFNYDRSLEHFLTETINRTFEGTGREKALEKLASLPIIHVHGRLGPYADVPYVEKRTVPDIQAGAKGISMIHDDHLDQSDEFGEAADLISTADEVLFLGFGYDQRSLRRLGALRDRKSPRYFGTARELQPQRRSEVEKMFAAGINLNRNNHEIAGYLPDFCEIRMKEREQRAQQEN